MLQIREVIFCHVLIGADPQRTDKIVAVKQIDDPFRLFLQRSVADKRVYSAHGQVGAWLCEIQPCKNPDLTNPCFAPRKRDETFSPNRGRRSLHGWICSAVCFRYASARITSRHTSAWLIFLHATAWSIYRHASAWLLSRHASACLG